MLKTHEVINKEIEEVTASWELEDYKNFVYDRLYDEILLNSEGEEFDV